jgi:DNA-binding transcriptional ArsR family regulator
VTIANASPAIEAAFRGGLAGHWSDEPRLDRDERTEALADLHFELFVDDSGLLAGRAAGEEAATLLAEQVAASDRDSVVTLDFSEVRDVAVSFAEPAMVAVLARWGQTRPIVARHVQAEAAALLRLIADGRHALTILGETGKPEVIGPTGQRLDTGLKTAAKIGEFTARELADSLGVSREAANYHVKRLYESGALRRWPTGSGRGADSRMPS